ncbi:MAG: hypothetical protein ACK5D0_02570 [Burkholderiaceae bacterium]|jgi:hypothetical protein
MVQSKKLIIFVFVFFFLETKDLNAWNLFGKKFDSYAQCHQYVVNQTNDVGLLHLALGFGCVHRYNSPEKIFLPNRSFLEVTRKKESIAFAIERIILENPQTFDKLYKGRLALPDGKLIDIKKPISGIDFWRAAANQFPDSFSALVWDPNPQYADFGACVIDNLSGWLDVSQKYRGIIKCGDKAGFARNLTLSLARPFSQDSIRQEAEQRARESTREFIRENSRAPLTCMWIGEFLNCH